ncbi:hypothetical protein KI387_000071, partial [Taxus chinensis]
MAAAATAGATAVRNGAPRAPSLPNLLLRSMPSNRRILPARVSSSYAFSSLFLSNPRKLFLNRSKPSNVYRSSIVAKAKVEKRLPEATLPYIDKGGELQTTSVTELTQGKKIFLWTVRSLKNLQRCVRIAKEFKADGLDTVVIVAGNEAGVVKEWKKELEVGDDIELLVDADSQFTKAMYVALGPNEDPSGFGVYVEDGAVQFSARK